MTRPDVLRRAWEQAHRDKGAAGIDSEIIEAIEAYGVSGCWRKCGSQPRSHYSTPLSGHGRKSLRPCYRDAQVA